MLPAIHTRSPALVFRAGAEARERIRMRGLPPGDVSILPGAAGGPKGIGIVGLDRAIFANFLLRAERSRTLVGASVGAWRFAAVVAAGNDSDRIAANLARLADLYTRQRFPRGMTAAEVSRRSTCMLDALLGDGDATIPANPHYRLVVVAARSRMLTGTDNRYGLALGLAGAAGGNLLSRRALRLFLERALIYAGDTPLPLGPLKAFRTHHVPLNRQNLRAALMATASIPLLMNGVRDLPGAPPGLYRDGGVLDYHLDLPWETDATVLYPHFTDRLIPGWFDKPLRWRANHRQRLRRALVVAPSADYLARLPHGKLPSRGDFRQFEGDDAGRERYWRQAIAESERLGDEFLEMMEPGKLADRLLEL